MGLILRLISRLRLISVLWLRMGLDLRLMLKLIFRMRMRLVLRGFCFLTIFNLDILRGSLWKFLLLISSIEFDQSVNHLFLKNWKCINVVNLIFILRIFIWIRMLNLFFEMRLRLSGICFLARFNTHHWNFRNSLVLWIFRIFSYLVWDWGFNISYNLENLQIFHFLHHKIRLHFFYWHSDSEEE